MKCDNCGKSEVTYYCKTNINGNVTEKHLCSECAGKLTGENTRDVFSEADSFFNSMFDDMFGGFFGRSLSPFRSFGGFSVPTLVMPKIEILLDKLTDETEKTETREEAKSEVKEDPELCRKREMNMLREEMKKAVDAEEFEKAAEIRDRIRNMEKD